MKRVVLALAVALLPALAHAEDKPTVTSLLKLGYDVVGVVPSPAGPGILLEGGDEESTILMMCFVAETKDSPDISTQYCKPVR